MTTIISSEKKTFFFYMLCVVLTPFIFVHINHGYILCGWGIFGLYRFIYLNDSISQKIPKILNLPSRILFGFNQEKKIYVEKIMHAYQSKYFLGFVLMALIFFLWFGFSYYTAFSAVPMDATSHVQKELVHYTYVSKLIQALTFLLAAIMGISFSQIKELEPTK